MMLDTTKPSRYHIGIKMVSRRLRDRGATPCLVSEPVNPLGDQMVTEWDLSCLQKVLCAGNVGIPNCLMKPLIDSVQAT